MHFSDIPKFTRNGSYEVNIPLDSIDETLTKWETTPLYGLQLNPEFQRGHVWTEVQQIAFIEYFLSGGVSGMVVYFNKPNWGSFNKKEGYNDFVCVDGLQRLTALRKFSRNEIKAFGLYMNEFDGVMPMYSDFKFNINNLKTEEEVLKWYIEMNSGGTPHTVEEIDRVKNMLKKKS